MAVRRPEEEERDVSLPFARRAYPEMKESRNKLMNKKFMEGECNARGNGVSKRLGTRGDRKNEGKESKRDSGKVKERRNGEK